MSTPTWARVQLRIQLVDFEANFNATAYSEGVPANSEPYQVEQQERPASSLWFVCLFVCLFIPFNVLNKSMTIVGHQILRSGFDPETQSKGPPNSKLFKPTVLYNYTCCSGQKRRTSRSTMALLGTLLANINRPVAYLKLLPKNPAGYSKR